MPQVKHFGAFKFHAEVTSNEIEECFSAMRGMVGRIPGLIKFIHGPYESSEGLNDGFTHGFIMTFDSPQSRDSYLPHPIHEEVKVIVVPKIEKVIAFDFNVSA
ncbi:Dabb family protein [Calycomorphotria hydatis]|uniref:Stress responsive A/B Barrel Domain protein n=1 Tax=Calycomorphotria hydatis TaxID=2528027 RepID=A0A517TA43_9PLAN|nr:Dabb family protein [Calycomorphotria hydatis]QDT65235.1 Stress responsive A/B Barrel Domain protein [Calycomorphotria hydatis]